MRVEGNTIIITAKQEIKEAGGVRTRVFEQKFSMPSGVKAELVKSSLTVEGVLVITAPRGNPAAKQSYTETVENRSGNWDKEPAARKKDPVFEDNKESRKKDSFFDEKDTRKKDSFFDDKDLRKKDSFFDDSKDLRKKDSFFDTDLDLQRKGSFFEDSERDFEQRRKRMMEDFNKDSIFDRRESAFDDMRRDFGSALSNTRHGSGFDTRSSMSRDRAGSLFEEENGVSKIVYEDDMYKILINVDKYTPEELTIKTVDNNVIVEAKHEEKTTDGRSYSTQSFNQSFSLPSGVNPESVTSSLSKSGILTIAAPLPRAIKSNGERLIPIKHS